MNTIPQNNVHSGSIVADILKQYPQVIPVFLKYRMLCVGCPLASFDTLRDAAINHTVPEAQLIQELHSVINHD